MNWRKFETALANFFRGDGWTIEQDSGTGDVAALLLGANDSGAVLIEANVNITELAKDLTKELGESR